MPIDISCPNCHSTLRVDDIHAGKHARCPNCETIVPIPLSQPVPPTPRPYPTIADGMGGPTGAQGGPGQFRGPGSDSANPYRAPYGPAIKPHQRYRESHRGGLILGVGIASLVCCALLGIVAIVMANEDLRKMDSGVMDPEGRGLTVAGRIIGIISLALTAVGIVLQIVIYTVLGPAAM